VSGKCYLSFSGAVTTPNNDSGRFGVSFYGSFTQPDSTGMAISMALSAITYGDANTYSTMSWTNTGQIAFRISTIIYANAS
jgi:hypothetical protein